MPWNQRIIQNNRESLALVAIKFTGRLAECRFRPLHTESALISAAYYAALMLELQPIQINLNGGIKNHASKIPKWSSGCRAILLL